MKTVRIKDKHNMISVETYQGESIERKVQRIYRLTWHNIMNNIRRMKTKIENIFVKRRRKRTSITN